MGYFPLSSSFDLTVQPYQRVEPLSVSFNLADDTGGAVVIFPAPPDFMVWSAHGITLTVSYPSLAAKHKYNPTPAQKEVISALRFGMAANEHDSRAPQNWDKSPIKDPASEDGSQRWDQSISERVDRTASGWDNVAVADQSPDLGIQAWDVSAAPKDGRSPQAYSVPALKDVIDIQAHIDSVKYWEMPVLATVDGYFPGSSNFNLHDAPYYLPSNDAVNFNLTLSQEIAEIFIPTRPVDAGPDLLGWNTNTPIDSRFRHPWDFKPRVGSEVDWGYEQEPPLPDKDPADVPEIKEAYLYMNASSLKKMPEGIPLEFADLQISLDIDSFSWSLSASILNSASMDQIKPGPSGPVEVEAKVNNKTWRFMIERYTVTSKHPKKSYKVSGSSLTQLLAAPYSAKQSAQIETPTNALQVIQGILENTGFEIDWDISLADYTIPVGAWGYENKTPIEVIDELVKAAGGVLVPATALSKLYAAQRYREAPPWYWPSIDSSSLDFQIADSTIISLSSDWQPSVEYRSVYVSGITQGVAVDVTKNGTDGTPAAPDVYDALNLTTQQCRGRGISILGQSGAQEIVTVELPLPTSGAPGLVVPGKWGEIQDTNDSDNDYRALVLSTTVSVSRPGASRATQTIRLERHHY